MFSHLGTSRLNLVNGGDRDSIAQECGLLLSMCRYMGEYMDDAVIATLAFLYIVSLLPPTAAFSHLWVPIGATTHTIDPHLKSLTLAGNS